MAISKRDNDKVYLFDESGRLTKEVLLAYVYGELSPKVNAEVEKIIENNEMYREAIEGIKMISAKGKMENILSQLDNEVGARAGIEKSTIAFEFYEYRKIAAIIIIFLFVGLIAFILLKNLPSGDDTNENIVHVQEQERPMAKLSEAKDEEDIERLDEEESDIAVEDELPAEEEPVNTTRRAPSEEREKTKPEQTELAEPQKKPQPPEQKIINSPKKKPAENIAGAPEPEADKNESLAGGALEKANGIINAEDLDQKTTRLPVPEEGKIFSSVDEMPQFPGGQAALIQYIKSNLDYPRKARRRDIEGKVYVSFVVDSDGSLSDIKVVQGVNPDLDDEAKRVVTEMPKWKPGKQNGVPVKVKQNLPIEFSLE